MKKTHVVRDEKKPTQTQYEDEKEIVVVGTEKTRRYEKAKDGSIKDTEGFIHLRERDGRIR